MPGLTRCLLQNDYYYKMNILLGFPQYKFKATYIKVDRLKKPGWSLIGSRKKCYFEQTDCFLPLSSPGFLILVWLTSEGWKTESTLQLSNCLEPGTPWLEFSATTTKQLLQKSKWVQNYFYGTTFSTYFLRSFL